MCLTTVHQPVTVIRLHPCCDFQHDSEETLTIMGIGQIKLLLIMTFTIRLKRLLAQIGQGAYT